MNIEIVLSIVMIVVALATIREMIIGHLLTKQLKEIQREQEDIINKIIGSI